MTDPEIAVAAASAAVRSIQSQRATCGSGHMMSMVIGALLATTYSSSREVMSDEDAKALVSAVMKQAENFTLDWIEDRLPIR